MRIDMREHKAIRDQVHAGLSALLVQGRQIWGDDFRQKLPDIMLRLMVGVGDLSRLARDCKSVSVPLSDSHGVVSVAINNELKKELGNVLFSTIRWIDDLGLDVLECLDLAIEAQEKFAKSGRRR